MNNAGKTILKRGGLHIFMCFAMFFLTASLTNKLAAQTLPSVRDSLLISTDSLSFSEAIPDSLANADSTQSLEAKLGIRISPDALPGKVSASATDSAVFDVRKSKFSLYGDAKVGYEDIKLSAGKVSFNQADATITASPQTDSNGIKNKPTFTQGSETVVYDSLLYNFKSKRAIVRNARSQYGEGFVFSQQVKRNPDQSIYGYRNVYTTCSLDTPHYGISARQIRIIPNRVIASGAANIRIEQVPTPFFLPFGLFPISEKQRSGFQLPSYTVEQNRGLGLTNGGYYFHFNDYVDLLMLTNIYTKGSYSVSGVSTYANRYHYNGGLSLSYAYNKTGEDYEPGATTDKQFNVTWRHQSDAKSRPGTSFNATVNAGSSKFFANNSYNTNQILNNQFVSSISYSKNWIGRPYSLSVAARHSQNTQTRQVNVTLPEVNFNINQFTPLQNKKRIGTPRWYEKISVSYNLNALNMTTFYDSSFSFNSLSGDDFRYGVKHVIPISAAYNLLRFINLSFGVNYNEYWYTRQNFYRFNDVTNTLDTTTNKGFFTARDVNANFNMSTRIYGIKRFKKGKLAGIRHVLTPNVGMSYTPDFAAAPFSYYYQTRLSPGGEIQYLSPYQGGVIGEPGLGQRGNFASTINFGLNNNLQIKMRDPKDTVNGSRNITLIDGLSINGSYNLAADSFNFSPLNVAFRTNLLNVVNLTGNAVLDPYGIDNNTGRRSPTTVYNEGNGIVRFRNANLAMSASFHSKEKNNRRLDGARGEAFNNLMQSGGYNNYVDFSVPWSLNVAYSVNLDNNYAVFSKRDSLIFTQSMLFSGDLNFTSRWKLTFSSGYDFVNKNLTLTSINIYRDLHCWEMRLGTIPFGPRKSYNFTLNVKATVLQDLKLVRRRDYRDAVAF